MAEEHAPEVDEGQGHDRMPEPRGKDFAVHEHPTDGKITDQDLGVGHKMLSAVSGSILTSLLVTPLDVVRVRLQSQHSPTPTVETSSKTGFTARSFRDLPTNLGVTACCREVFWVNNNAPYCIADTAMPPLATASGSNFSSECAVEETQRRTFTSTLDGLRKIARNEGFTTLWRGLSPTLVMAVPGNVIYFAGYDWLRTSSRSPMFNRVPDTYSPLVAGSTARVLAAFCVSPIELFRTRMQASTSTSAAANFAETAASVRDMVSSQGYHTLWRGLSLTLWRDVPFSALYWWGYELTRNSLVDARERMQPSGAQYEPTSSKVSAGRQRAESRSRQNHTTTLIDSFASGAFSGGIASIITTPFDVGKTRQQVYRQSGDAPGSMAAMRPEEGSMPRLLWNIFKEEGVPGLFRGWAPRMLKVAPACAIMISTYEMGKKMAVGRVNAVEE